LLPEHGSPITVLVADDHAGFRNALEALLRSAPDVMLLGSACCGEEAVSMAARLRPEVVLMDLVMPGVTGIDATRRVRTQQQPPAVIAAGATVALLKEEDPDQLLDAIRAAAGR
jgi:DNA-binding NarL/FixJ family response regulator